LYNPFNWDSQTDSKQKNIYQSIVAQDCKIIFKRVATVNLILSTIADFTKAYEIDLIVVLVRMTAKYVYEKVKKNFKMK
jgi:predicted transcriptional regulator